MGDGGITDYHVDITLNSEDEIDYSNFIINLIKEIFKIEPKIYFRKNKKAMTISMHRKLMTNYLVEIGLKRGDKIKQDLDIPNWIMINDDYSKACIRGLFDTDGCFFIHKYRSKNKIYFYPKVSFTSMSKPLILSVARLLKKYDMYGRINKQHNSVNIDNQKDVARFMSLIGTNNPKNKARIELRRRG